jgi:hypothetical protein
MPKSLPYGVESSKVATAVHDMNTHMNPRHTNTRKGPMMLATLAIVEKYGGTATAKSLYSQRLDYNYVEMSQIDIYA